MNSSPSTSSVNFPCGSILYGKRLLPSGSYRVKYFITLNKQPDDEVMHFVFTTSQTKFFDKRSQFRSEFVKIRKGEIRFFPLETLINCTTVHSERRDILEMEVKQRKLKILGALPENYLDQIRGIIEKSMLVEDDIKNAIV